MSQTRGELFAALNERLIRCDQCPRLVAYRQEVARTRRKAFRDREYWGRPVPNFGDPNASLLIVGLAPAAHGANRTGRMFTGDRSGDWLYRALFETGFANQPQSHSSDDGLILYRCAITAVCHCAPPKNKPTLEELAACNRWLVELLDIVPARVFVALGRIAWTWTWRAFRAKGWVTGGTPPFAHGEELDLPGGRVLLGSYHPSQQNTFTGRLTKFMFQRIFERARELIEATPGGS